MSMNPLTPDDPRLTAYVLGELHGAERAEVERQLADSLALREAADELRQTTALLGAAFDAEPAPALSESERQAITAAALRNAPTPVQPTARPVATSAPRRGAPAVMAVAAIALLAGVVLTLHDTADDERTTIAMTEAEESTDLYAVMDQSGVARQRGREAGARHGGQAGNENDSKVYSFYVEIANRGGSPDDKNAQSSAPGSGSADGKGVQVGSLFVKQMQQGHDNPGRTVLGSEVQLLVTPNISRLDSATEGGAVANPGGQPGQPASDAPWHYQGAKGRMLGDALVRQQGQARLLYEVPAESGRLMFGAGVNSNGGQVGSIVLSEENFDHYGRVAETPPATFPTQLEFEVAPLSVGFEFQLSGLDDAALNRRAEKLAELKKFAELEGVVTQLVAGKKLKVQDAEQLKRELAEVAAEQAQEVKKLQEQLRQQVEKLREATEPPRGEQYLPIVENEFIEPVGQAALSTFSIDVDTASYTNMRRFLRQGQLPPPAAVRIEELLNYFRYDYPQPPDGQPFSVNTEVAPCPWNPKHRLLRFGIKAREIGADQRPKSNLVFLVDTSGSMSSGDKLPLVKEGLELLAGEMGEGDRVAIVTYAGSAGTALPSTPGTDRQRIVDVIRGLVPNGSTNGAGGITAAYDVAVSNFIEDGTNRVILCTDGDFNVGVSDQQGLETLIEEKRKSGVFLSVFGFGTGNIQDGKMEQLANKGNGVYAYVDSLREAKRVFVREMTGTLYTIAKDVKLQVEFNPTKVGAYRLIGYENRVLAAQDFHDDTKDAGEIGAGHTVTALYEIIPVGLVPKDQPKVDDLKYQSNPKPLPPEASDELCTLKLRHKKPDADKSTLFRFPVKDLGADAEVEPSPELEWQAAVAGFGMILRDSKYRGHASYPLVKELALSGLGDDERGSRREFIDLVMRAEQIARQRAGIAPPPPVQLEEAAAREKASIGGTYTNLLQTVHAPNDFAAYGNYYEWGHWSGSEWAGQENLPAGHWVYVYPNWYIWGEKGQTPPARAEKPVK